MAWRSPMGKLGVNHSRPTEFRTLFAHIFSFTCRPKTTLSNLNTKWQTMSNFSLMGTLIKNWMLRGLQGLKWYHQCTAWRSPMGKLGVNHSRPTEFRTLFAHIFSFTCRPKTTLSNLNTKWQTMSNFSLMGTLINNWMLRGLQGLKWYHQCTAWRSPMGKLGVNHSRPTEFRTLFAHIFSVTCRPKTILSNLNTKLQTMSNFSLMGTLINNWMLRGLQGLKWYHQCMAWRSPMGKPWRKPF